MDRLEEIKDKYASLAFYSWINMGDLEWLIKEIESLRKQLAAATAVDSTRTPVDEALTALHETYYACGIRKISIGSAVQELMEAYDEWLD